MSLLIFNRKELLIRRKTFSLKLYQSMQIYMFVIFNYSIINFVLYCRVRYNLIQFFTDVDNSVFNQKIHVII